MMECVNLTNLRSMTDGDVEMEQQLFKEFCGSFENGLSVLNRSCEDSAADAWRIQSHALKGISLNLGADKLGFLCKKAQDSHTASMKEKEDILEVIKAEYVLVKQFLDSVQL